ncbi:TonB-dependent receptor domain-containing protein [Vibrio viridaestus]|uniref:TonB-dependent receptor n=1 Tax=Vibrio viridaestus TaxID=2487322 RepID=A0A3N9TF55_9VIBR|nr:TonB-dependent receptor [Vibrio viridaestus]RQW62868.1 TonB-dependent receptor [Vibrio viridaestus]
MSTHFAIKAPKLSFLSVAVLSSFSTFAAATPDQTDDTVVVTASGYDQSLKNASASVSVVTREQLESKYYRDITDVLSDVPGVIITGGGDKTDISIRGMGSSYTLILVDGKPISTRATRPNSDNSGIESAWLPPLEAIERIEVIKGPMSTLYGSDAMGGVINIITRRATEDWTGSIQLGTVYQENRNSGDEQSVNFYVTGPISDKATLQIYGQNQQRDEDNITNGYSDKSLQSIGSKLNYQVNDDHEIIVDASVNKQERRSNADKSYDASGTYASGTYSENKYQRTSASLEHKGRWNIGQSDTFLQYEYTKNPSRSINLQNTDFKSTMVIPFEVHTLSFGMQGEYEKIHDETTNTGGDLTKLSKYSAALFAEDEWRVFDDISVIGGIRYDYDENYGSHFSPRLYSVWNINEAWTLKGGVSTGFKAPSLKQSNADWVSVSHGGDRYGNPDLEPETSVTEEISLAYQNEQGLKASLGLFNNDFNDMISTETCTASTCDTLTNQWSSTNKRYVNIDEAVTRGVEASIDTPLTETLDFKVSYTYTYTKQKTGDSAGEPLNNFPEHLASANLDWQATDKLMSWAKVTYHGEEATDTGDDIVPSYTFVDTGVTYDLADNVKLKAAVYNLLDKDIDYDTYGYVEDGRRYWLGMDINF